MNGCFLQLMNGDDEEYCSFFNDRLRRDRISNFSSVSPVLSSGKKCYILPYSIFFLAYELKLCYYYNIKILSKYPAVRVQSR